MNGSNRLIFILVLLSLLLPWQSTGQEIDTEEFFPRQFADKVTRTGRLDFKRTLTLSFKNQGYLKRLKVDEGEYFAADSLLASLEIAELQAQRNAAYAELLKAKSALKREKSLADEQVSSADRLENLETLVETTRASYRIAQYNLAKSTVMAPFDGLVLKRHTELGELQTPGAPVLTVAATHDNLVVKVALTENEVMQLALGTIVDVKIQQLGVVQGRVSKIPAIADAASHLFNIEIALPELVAQPGIIAGQLAEVTIMLASNEAVYRLPIKALISVDEQGQALFAVKEPGQAGLVKKAFAIKELSNQFVFVNTYSAAPPLNIVTEGWQHLLVEMK